MPVFRSDCFEGIKERCESGYQSKTKSADSGSLSDSDGIMYHSFQSRCIRPGCAGRGRETRKGRLSYTSSGSGTVVPVQENMVFLWPGQQVEWAAEVGSTVKAGECLVQFRMEYLQQTIESKQAELTQLELQAGQQQISARGTVRVPSAERAGQTLADAQRQLQEAQQRAAEAQAAYEQFQAGQSAAVQSQSAYVVTDSANDILQPSNPSPHSRSWRTRLQRHRPM